MLLLGAFLGLKNISMAKNVSSVLKDLGNRALKINSAKNRRAKADGLQVSWGTGFGVRRQSCCTGEWRKKPQQRTSSMEVTRFVQPLLPSTTVRNPCCGGSNPWCSLPKCHWTTLAHQGSYSVIQVLTALMLTWIQWKMVKKANRCFSLWQTAWVWFAH